MADSKKINKERAEKDIFNAIIAVSAIVLFVVLLFPYVIMVLTSLKP
jgi:ABC-type glycerol-3-phosphate transport system permease component